MVRFMVGGTEKCVSALFSDETSSGFREMTLNEALTCRLDRTERYQFGTEFQVFRLRREIRENHNEGHHHDVESDA